MKMLGRIGVWACSLGLSALVFSLAFSLLVNGSAAVNPFFLVTVKLALPAWCLYLPLVIIVKSAEGRMKQVLLLAGAMVGPFTVLVAALIALARGSDARSVWQGDPLTGIGAATGSIFAAIVGVITVAFYLAGLRFCFRPHNSETAASSDSVIE